MISIHWTVIYIWYTMFYSLSWLYYFISVWNNCMSLRQYNTFLWLFWYYFDDWISHEGIVMLRLLNCLFFTGGLGPIFNQNSIEFSIDFSKLEYSRCNVVIEVYVSIFQTSFDIVVCLAGSWDVFRKTEAYPRKRGGCHMFDLLSPGVTVFPGMVGQILRMKPL